MKEIRHTELSILQRELQSAPRQDLFYRWDDLSMHGQLRGQKVIGDEQRDVGQGHFRRRRTQQQNLLELSFIV